MKTFAEAAEAVLADIRKAMTAVDLWIEIERRGLVVTNGKTPVATLYTELMRKSANWASDDDDRAPMFYRRGDGAFGRWADLAPAQQQAILGSAQQRTSAQVWRELHDKVKDEPSWRERIARLAELRARAGAQISTRVQSYLSSQTALEQLRAEFNQRTRTDWDCFGFSGASFAMQLNLVAKLVVSSSQLEAVFRNAMAAPASEVAARAAMQAVVAAIGKLRAAGQAPKQLYASRVLTLLTGFWYAQARELWPGYYTSARDALEETDVAAPVDDDPVESYLGFRAAYRQLQKDLGLSELELQQLCLVQQEAAPDTDGDEPKVEPTPASPRGDSAIPPRYWKVAPGTNAEQWPAMQREGVIAVSWHTKPVGDLRQYRSKDELDQKYLADFPTVPERARRSRVDQLWRFRGIAAGDVIVANQGYAKLVGEGVATGAYFHRPDHVYAHALPVRWDHTDLRRIEDQGPRWRSTVVELSQEDYEALFDLDDADNEGGDPDGGESSSSANVASPLSAPPYTLQDALRRVFLSHADLTHLVELLKYKKNLVLQGPPGVGKTFVAAELAYLLMGYKDDTRIRRVQFHQSYSYEDFVRGYRPRESGGFDYRDGPMLSFCEQARRDDRPHVLIIDEINRGNLSKILGELMLLIEPDKREARWAVELAYARADEPAFWVPPNLHVIGTMNTADRSLALVDYALRRRFVFFSVPPAFEQGGFEQFMQSRDVAPALRSKLVARLTELNRGISEDERNLGSGYVVGHSYFCQADPQGTYDEAWYERIVRFEIEPLLAEYWAESPDKVKKAVAALLGP